MIPDYNKYIQELPRLYPNGIAFVEAGMGKSLGATLCDFDGASKVVKYALTPYSKQAQTALGLSPNIRSVSEEGVLAFRNFVPKFPLGEKPFIVSVSGSLESDLSKGRKHCYIHFSNVGTYHITFQNLSYNNHARPELSNFIHYLILESLLRRSIPAEWGLRNFFPAFVVDFPDLQSLMEAERGMMYVGHSDLMTVLRNGFSIFRGSFNPPTNSHMSMVKPYKTIFEIALDNVDKTFDGYNDIRNRIEMITRLGYPVLITKGFPRFSHLIMYIRTHLHPTLPINFILGADTSERVFVRDIEGLEHSWLDDENVSWSIYQDKLTNISLDKYPPNCVFILNNLNNIRSSKFRENKDLSTIPQEIHNYIKDNHLYGI